MVPLTQRSLWSPLTRRLDDSREQWVIEVETWFMKAILSAILQVQDGAQYNLENLSPNFSDKYIRDWSLPTSTGLDFGPQQHP